MGPMGPGGPGFMMRPAVVHQFPMMEQPQQHQQQPQQQQPMNGTQRNVIRDSKTALFGNLIRTFGIVHF